MPTISSSWSIQNPVVAAPPQENVPFETGSPEVAGFVTTEPVMPKPTPHWRDPPNCARSEVIGSSGNTGVRWLDVMNSTVLRPRMRVP